MRKLLIADANEEFRMALADQMRGTCTVRVCKDGKQALELLHSMKPDILVVDLMLPELDGISLLQQAAQAGLQPMVLATTRFANDYVLDSAERLGVGYVMMKPCDVRATAARIDDLSERLKLIPMAQPDPETQVTAMLLDLQIPTKYRGFTFLRIAILEAIRDPNQMLTKEIYPKVAKMCGGTTEQVERSIRGAIKHAWLSRDEQIWRMYFHSGPHGTLERPTNGEFISGIASRVVANRIAREAENRNP